MGHSNNVLEYDWMTCIHLDESYYQTLQDFTSVRKSNDGGFLAEYIKHTAFIEEREHLARTYLVLDKDSSEVIAYFSLRNGFVAANERRMFIKKIFDSAPGIEISNFAINGAYRSKHPSTDGIGKIIFTHFIIPVAEKARAYSGANIIYIFALNNTSLIKHYEGWNFSRLSKLQEKAMHSRIRPRYDAGCIFMFQKL